MAFDEHGARSGEEGVALPPVLEEARSVLYSLAERMITSEPEDFLLVSVWGWRGHMSIVAMATG